MKWECIYKQHAYFDSRRLPYNLQNTLFYFFWGKKEIMQITEADGKNHSSSPFVCVFSFPFWTFHSQSSPSLDISKGWSATAAETVRLLIITVIMLIYKNWFAWLHMEQLLNKTSTSIFLLFWFIILSLFNYFQVGR